MYIVWCLVKSCKLHPALIECSISELRHFGCRIFDIRRTADRLEKIRSEEGYFGCRIFDIRRTADRIEKIEFATFDPTECTRLKEVVHAHYIFFEINFIRICFSFYFSWLIVNPGLLIQGLEVAFYCQNYQIHLVCVIDFNCLTLVVTWITR